MVRDVARCMPLEYPLHVHGALFDCAAFFFHATIFSGNYLARFPFLIPSCYRRTLPTTIRESTFWEVVISRRMLIEPAYSTMTIESAPAAAADRSVFPFTLSL